MDDNSEREKLGQPPTKRSKKETDILSKKDDILNGFEDWFHNKHKEINIRHLYMGKVCSSREKLLKGATVIVSVIESKEAIESEEYKWGEEIFTVVYKLWEDNSIYVCKDSMSSRKEDYEKMIEINNYLKKNTDTLLKEHSNMEMVRSSLLRLKTHEGITVRSLEPCIAIYCSYKGVVPLGEKEFPAKMDGFTTDIREGFFHLHCNYDICANSKDQLDPVRMGASISKCQNEAGEGTLGGFVELNNGKVGFITCAHVLHTPDQMLTRSTALPIPIVQPSVRREGSQRCGTISRSAFPKDTTVDGVSVDATVVELTERIPDRAMFADLTTARLRKHGFSRSRLPRVCCGKLLSREELEDLSTVRETLKCGTKTGLTLGKLENISFCKFRNISMKYGRYSTEYKSQLVIRGKNGTRFSDEGDSGALVFQFKDPNDLKCIGMIVGGDGYVSYATPITSVLEALSVTLKDF